jgi:hypothetical protein
VKQRPGEYLKNRKGETAGYYYPKKRRGQPNYSVDDPDISIRNGRKSYERSICMERGV